MAKGTQNTQAPALVRTIVPVAVGQLVAWLATINVSVADEQRAAITSGLGALVTIAYYAVVHALEQKLPWIGALLGYAASPDSYSPGSVPDPTDADEGVADDGDEDSDDPDDGDDAEPEGEPDESDDPEAAEVDETPVPDDYEPKH